MADEADKKEEAKRRNAIHHQRWLQKQEVKKKALYEKFRLETAMNAQLKASNEKLTSLLAQAKYLVAVHTAKTEEEE